MATFARLIEGYGLGIGVIGLMVLLTYSCAKLRMRYTVARNLRTRYAAARNAVEAATTVAELSVRREATQAADVDDDEDQSPDCGICLAGFRDGQAVRVLSDCPHAFHVACIDKWLKEKPSCPVCRHSSPAPSPQSQRTPAPAAGRT